MAKQVDSLCAFFGLKEHPFAATADPTYFYATPGHREALFRLWNSIDEQQGIAVVLGNYGTGKTTLLRKILTGMREKPGKYNTAVLASPIPSWTTYSLLENIVTQFRLKVRERSFAAAMEALNQYLLRKRDQITTLIIDDAQNLNKRGQLEVLRLAQNIETRQRKLLNLVFFAQLEWSRVLRAAPNFLQRVNMTYTLQPISEEDTRGLIHYRLRRAAGNHDLCPVFEEQAIKAIYAYTQGSPRMTVTLCRNVLVLAAQLKERVITQAAVLHTIEKTMLPDTERQKRVSEVLKQASPPEKQLPPAMDLTPGKGEISGPSRRRANEILLRAASREELRPRRYPRENP